MRRPEKLVYRGDGPWPVAALNQNGGVMGKAQGIAGGNFYWYDNNWHYIRKWHHLKKAVTLNNLNDAQREALLTLNEMNFDASDAVMSRCISTSIALVWTEEQAKEKAEKIKAAVQKVLKHQSINA